MYGMCDYSVIRDAMLAARVRKAPRRSALSPLVNARSMPGAVGDTVGVW